MDLLKMIIPIIRNPNNKFTVARVHYSLDPDKDNKEWMARAMAGMTERGWNREYEIDYSSYAGKPFFPEFKEYNIGEVKYQSGEVLYRGWDFGFHRPCCVITKLNQFDQWGLMKVILGKDEGIFDFGRRVDRFCKSEYPGAKYVDACDPAGQQMSDKGESTSIQILNNIGIYPQFRKQPIKQGAEIIRQKLKMRADGKVGLLIDKTQSDIIDGFRGGIHYPEVREGQPEKEHYEKDGYYDHIFDSVRYIATEMFTVIGQTQARNEIAQDSLEYAYRDGRPVEEQDVNSISSQTQELSEFFGL